MNKCGLRHNYDGLRKKLRPEVTKTRHEHDSVVAFANTISSGYDNVVVLGTTISYDNWAASLNESEYYVLSKMITYNI